MSKFKFKKSFDKTPFVFDAKYLNGLENEKYACVEVSTKKEHLALHPYQLENIKKSINDVLDWKIAKYNKGIEGILLGYKNVKLFGNTGEINFDSCFIHYDIQAEFIVFKPEVGSEIIGVVTKKSTDHFAALVHNKFNVSIPKPQDKDDWLGDEVDLNDEVLLKIIVTDFESRLPYMCAEIVSVIKKSKSKIEANKKIKFTDDDETPKSKKRKLSEDDSIHIPAKKKKKNSSSIENEESNISDLNKSQKKKRKRSKSEQLSDPEPEEIPVKKSKKKKNKDKNAADMDDVEEQKVDTSNIKTEISDPELEEILVKKSKKKKNKDKNAADVDDVEEQKVDTSNIKTEISDPEPEEIPVKKSKKKKKNKDKEAVDMDDVEKLSENLIRNPTIKTKKSKKKSKSDN